MWSPLHLSWGCWIDFIHWEFLLERCQEAGIPIPNGSVLPMSIHPSIFQTSLFISSGSQGSAGAYFNPSRKANTTVTQWSSRRLLDSCAPYKALICPYLNKLLWVITTLPMTSCSIERLFSHAGWQWIRITPRVSRSTPCFTLWPVWHFSVAKW